MILSLFHFLSVLIYSDISVYLTIFSFFECYRLASLTNIEYRDQIFMFTILKSCPWKQLESFFCGVVYILIFTCSMFALFSPYRFSLFTHQPDGPRQILIPIPVPIFIPVPMQMYTTPVPFPIGINTPVPVPMFIPVAAANADQLIKTMQEVSILVYRVVKRIL